MPQYLDTSRNETQIKGAVRWLRIVGFSNGATISFEEGRAIPINGLEAYEARKGLYWKQVDVTGTVRLQYSQDMTEPFPGPVNAEGITTDVNNNTIVVPGGSAIAVSGSLANTTDTPITLAVSGTQYGTVQLATTLTGTAQLTLEQSLDGGRNWLPSGTSGTPYAKRIDLTVANPSTISFVAVAPVTGSIYEYALEANCTHVRVRCAGNGTAWTGTLNPGAIYIAGSVAATLYDVTESGIGAGINTSILPFDVSGWSALSFVAISPTTNGIIVRPIDDTGSPLSGSTITMTAPGTTVLTLSRLSGASAVSVQPLGSGGIYGFGLMGRRIAWYLNAGGTVSNGRIRVEAYR